MGKQVEFFIDEADKSFLVDLLYDIFENPIDIPYYKKDNFLCFDFIGNGHEKYYISELKRGNKIIYKLHEYSDGSKAYILDYYKSPVFEFDKWFKNINGEYVSSRFFINIDKETVDIEFTKKVSNLFLKIKNEFWYNKKWKSYISKKIDIENSLFLGKKILKEDLK